MTNLYIRGYNVSEHHYLGVIADKVIDRDGISYMVPHIPASQLQGRIIETLGALGTPVYLRTYEPGSLARPIDVLNIVRKIVVDGHYLVLRMVRAIRLYEIDDQLYVEDGTTIYNIHKTAIFSDILDGLADGGVLRDDYYLSVWFDTTIDDIPRHRDAIPIEVATAIGGMTYLQSDYFGLTAEASLELDKI